MPSRLGFIDGEYCDGEVAGLGAVFGLRRMGKSTEVIRLANQCRGTVIFWDYTGNHGGLVNSATTVHQPGKLKDVLRARTARKRLAVRYVPRDREFVEHFRAMCAICAAVGDLVLIVDEVDAVCGAQWGQTRMCPELYELVHMGRHHHVSMMVTARDTASVPINLRSQCDTFRLFRTTEQGYIDYLAKRIGKQNALRLPSLPQYEYLLWNSGEEQVRIMKGGKEVRTPS